MQERVREQNMWSETILEKWDDIHCKEQTSWWHIRWEVAWTFEKKKKKMFDVNRVEQESDANTCSLHTLEINWNSYTEDDYLNSNISPKEVTEAIHHLKANKAAGPDGIFSRGLQACWW